MSVGCLWDSICTKRKAWQCLWGSVGLQYNKKKCSQCLWGSAVVLVIIFQCLWDVCATQYAKKNHLQCLWGSVVVLITFFNVSGMSVGLSILKRIICNVRGAS